MPKFTGKNATIKFGGTEYTCLTDVGMSGGVDAVSASCSTDTGNAETYKAVGAENWTVSTTILLESASIDAQTAFAPGTSAALTVYPNGQVSGEPQYDWVSAFVSSDNETVAVAGMATMTITFECDGTRTPSLVP
jgi:hypothetical protein